MSEPLRPERAAARGKFRIWIETSDGSDIPVAEQFETVAEAQRAAKKVAEDDTTMSFSRIIVYDDVGFFEYMLGG